jgi:hypothetical protein
MTKFTSAELNEIAQLFRSKLASLREPKRPVPRRPRRPRSVRLPDEQPDSDALLRPGELAALLGVAPKTVTQWDLPVRSDPWRSATVPVERSARPTRTGRLTPRRSRGLLAG